MYIYVTIYIYICMQTFTCKYIYKFTYIRNCIHVNICIIIYIYTYLLHTITHAHTRTHTHTHARHQMTIPMHLLHKITRQSVREGEAVKYYNMCGTCNYSTHTSLRAVWCCSLAASSLEAAFFGTEGPLAPFPMVSRSIACASSGVLSTSSSPKHQ